MNAIYKVIWNDAIRQYQVVNELCRSRRKACSVKAVHIESVSGAHFVVSSLKRGAVLAGSALTMLIGWGEVAQAQVQEELPLDGLVVDLGGATASGIPPYSVDQLPGAGGSIVINRENITFSNVDRSIYSQDETGRYITLFEVQGQWVEGSNVSLVLKENGVATNTVTVDSDGNLARFTYDVEAFWASPNMAQFVLKNIELTSNVGYGQFLEVSQDEVADLKASLTGGGNVTFGFGTSGSEGYLTLAGDGDNTYSGSTFVGFTSDGNRSASPVTIYFGKTKAFGNTLNLNVEAQSKVFIGGKSQTEDYEQTVHGLQGEGLVHLGTQAKLTLDQSGTGTGNYSADEGGFIRIDNKFAGTGNADDPTAGAWFDIKLSGEVAGDIVRFSDNAVYDEEGNPNYTGVIALENGAIEAYDEDRRLDPEGRNYSPNLILTTSTLRLENNGCLLVDGTSGADTVHNLFLNNSADWMSGAANNNALSFENVGFGGAALTVTGDLTLEKDATVNVDSFTETLDDAVAGKSFFDADGGLESALIVVEGEVDLGNDYKLHLKGEATGDSGTDVTQGGNIVAKAHWDFSDTLKYVSGGDESDSFNIEYTLKQIDIVSGQTFTLETADGSSTEGQDFTALITGSGNLTVDASGFTVNIGHSGGNTYTGDTTVTGGTNVNLTENNAFGTGAGSLDIAEGGSVTLKNGVSQSGSGLSGNGSLVLESDSKYTLTQNSDATIDNIISGSGTLKVDLVNDGNELKFTAGKSFTGTLDLINAALDLTDSGNAGTLGSSSIVLGDNTDFTFGKGSAVRDLHVKGDAELNADTLIIGGDAVLNISGSLTYDRDLSFDVKNVEVAADLNLIDYDGAFVGNNFIDAGSSQGQGNVSIAVSGGQQTVLDYTQKGNVVAETTWDIGTGLTDTGTGLDASVQLKAINVLGENSLSIYGNSSGQKELSAKLSSESASGTVVFEGGDILVSNGANDYTAATHIDSSATVKLGASHALGETSELANYGKLVVNTGIEQTVFGWVGKADGSIELNGSLLLNQSGEQTIANTFTGSGTFTVDLSGSGNELSFANDNAFSGFSGKLLLGNLIFDAAETSSSLLSNTDVVINGGAIFVADAIGTPVQTSDFTFNGGTLRVGQIEAGNNTGAKLAVSGDINIDSASTIELEGVKLEGTQNILAADQGVEQTIATYTGAVSSNLDALKVSGVGTSEIRNNSSDADPAAYGKWSTGALTAESGKLDVRLTLEEIQLADTDVGLKLDATGLTGDKTISAKITDYETTAGKIVFEGGNITIANTNDYHGVTVVESGSTVTVAAESGFGNTSELDISAGAVVNLQGFDQTVGRLVVGSLGEEASNALNGTDISTLTLADGGTSEIWGSNNYSGTIVLGSGHDLAINNASGIGASAKVGFSAADSVLTIEGAKSGTFGTELLGSGTVVIRDSSIAVADGNTNFTGRWELESNAGVTVSDNVDAVLGTGAVVALDGTLTLGFASNSATDVTIDEKLSGSGSLVLTGNSNQKFGLAQSGSNFSGTVTLDKISMTVGGSGTGTNNANAFKTADLVLQGGSVLEVATGSTVTTFDKVSVNNGQTAGFKFGGLGFNSDGTTATGTSALVINELVNNGAAQITLDALGTNGDLLGAVAETSLVNGGVDVFQALIQTGKVMDESILNNFTLTGVGTGQATQEIKSVTEPVATGYYDFDLALGDSGTDLGVSYDLTRIDISGGKTLTLYEEGTLDAQLTSESGSGNLTIAAGGKIILANDSANALNSYTGVTNVLGTLTAHAGNLGSTSELRIGASGHYVNAGNNKVGLLDTDGTLELWTGHRLEITQNSDESSNISGTLTGGGDLLFAEGDLIVTGTTPSDYDGTVYVGSANSDAVLTISGAGALGTGSIVLGKHSGSQVNIYGTEGQTFANEISGFGTINVNLSGGAFAFGTEQLGLSTGSTLVLDGATFDLTSSDVNFNDDVAGKLAIELTDGSKLINDGSADKDVYSLTLNGGTIDLGEINTEFGQINLVSEEGTLNIINKTTIDIASQSDDNVTESGDRTITDGSELLTGGVFYLDIFTGVKNLNGIENLVLEQGFSGTTEKLLQDADPDSEGLELVANMTRDDGTFKYDGSKVYLEYRFKEIELLREELNQGLLVDAEQKPGGTLSAKITGSGNLKLDGTLNLGTAGTVNDYTGRTYVLGDGVVTIQADSAFGQTKDLDIATGGVVKLNGFDQTVGALSGTGKLEFASGSDFKLDNYLDKEGAQSIDINNELVGAAGSTFTIDGTYGTGENDHASVSFGRENNLGGMTFTLRNAKFDIGGTGDFDYLTSRSANDFVLSTGAAVTVNGTSGNLYDYNELSFAGGSLDVTNVTLVKEGTGASTAAVIETNRLDLNGNGTLSVAAKIDSSFDVLADDQANFVSTLIKYGELDGNKSNLKPSTTFSSSAIEQGGTNVAYVNWDGDITVDESAKTVGMSYRVAAIQLADETGDGLKLSTGNTAGVDAALDALVTDYGTHAGNITFDGGRITIGSGTVDEKANTYTGTTNVRSNSTVTLAKDGAFGRTDLLNISNGQVNFNGKSETLGSINVGSSGSITGAGSVTLGIAGYDEKSSTILGEHSGFTADVTLANGHTLTLNDTIGIGSSGTIKLESGTDLVINDEAGGNFTKTVSGADSAEILLSGKAIGIFADNSNYLGNWTLTDGTTVSVNGSGNVGVDAILGAGGTVALGNTGALTLSQDSGSISVDNVFAGAGELVVTGTEGQTFDFSRKWSGAEASGFTGTLSLNGGIQTTVGGLDDSSGVNNAANLAYADFNLGSASTLNVALQDSIVDTFDVLNVSGGTISFAGEFGLGATTEELGRLQVGSLSGSGNIALTIPDANDTVDQTIKQNDLLTIDDVSHFQALITAETGTVSESGWTLNGNTTTSGSGLRQAVRNAGDTETVAHAIYDYALATGKVNSESDSLGIEYTLKTVDIVDTKTLELSESGSLSAVITDSSGAGTLLVKGQIELTGQNEYESVTRVSGPNASLTVEQSGLGNTTALLLEGNVAFINEGTNSVGYLNASGSNIKLNEALTLTGGNVSEIVGGTISGTHALNVQKNQLQVSGNINAKDFSGDVNLGDGNSGAILELDGVAGIGTGSVNFVTGTSSVYVKGTTGTSLTNTYSGGGKIAVNLGGSTNVFDFSVTQAKNGASGSFTGELVLEKAGYHLYDDEGELASATLVTSGGGYVTVNAGSDIANHKVDGLSLYGGTLDFGLMTEGSESGQIVVGSDGFATNASKTVVKVALGENNNATGSDVFDLNSDLSVLLIKGFNASGRDLDSLDFSGSAEVDQLVKQSGRYADGSATAKLTYSSGHLVGDESGISAAWDLSKINLLAGNEEGFRIDASAETGQSGTISALITGEGSIEFAGGTITLNHANNTYTGNTYVTDGKLELDADEALGDSALLAVTGSGAVSVGETDQSIGSISVAGENGLSMDADGSLTLTSGASTISSANNGVSGTVALSGKGTTLTIQNASGVGGDDTTISLGDDTSVIFAGAGFTNAASYADINNVLAGSGTVQIGDGSGSTYLELLNTNNAFGKLLVTSGATVLVNDMHADNALGDAAVNIKSGGIARLYGSSGWTISNDLNLVEGGELVLAADDEAVNFAGTNQIISGGKVTLQSSVLYLGGDQGSSGATNAAVLDTAHLNVGSNGVLHVATGNDAQVLDKLTLGSSGHIWFDGTLGVSGTGTTQLGQLKVGSLGDMTGTIHLTASSAAGSGGEIDAAELLNVADSGSFQSLIEVIGTDETITNDELSGTNLDVSGNTSVVSDIKDGSGNTVAEGTFGFGGTLVATEDGKHAGVQYELQLINLLQTLEISESGSLNVQITGSGNLLVSNALTLTNKEGETNDYSGATTVSGTGSLVAGAGALGKTSALNVNESGSFTNSGDNTVGIFDLSGSAVLNEGTTLTVLGTTGETNDFTGTLTGSGSLALESGKTVVSQNNSGYAGNVVLGKKDGGLGAEIHFNAGASLGTGTITFAYNLGVLSVEASGETTLTNKLDLSADGGEIVVSGDGDDTFAFHADQAASGFGAGSKLTLTRTNYSFTTAGNDVLNNVALSVASGTLTVNGDADLSDRSVYGLSLTDAVVDFGKLGNGDGVLDLESQNLTIGGSSGSTTVRLDSEFQSVESDTGSAAFMQGGSLTLIRDASNDFSGDLSKLKLELDGAASAGTAIEQAVIQNNVETARLEGTAQGFGAVQGEDDGLWDLNLNLSFTTLRINKDSTFTVSEDGDIGLVITDNGADAAGSLSISDAASVQLLEANSYHGETSVSSRAELILAADNALGYTSALNTETGTSVAFGDTNQTIGEIHASGALVSDKDASGKLTITSGGEVSGANSGFYLDVDLTGNGDLTLTDVASLGTDNRVTITNADAELVLAGAGGSFSNGLTIGSTGKVSFESTSGGTLAFEDANIYGTLELNNVTFDLDAHGDAFNRGSSLVANAGTRIDVSDAVSGAVSNITLNSGSTVAFDNGTPGAAGEGEVASINLGSSGTLTLAGDVTVDLDINDYADASDVEDAQGDLINRPLTAQDLTGQDGGAVLATLIAGQVSSATADLNLKTDGNDVEENKLNIAIRNAANGEEVATGTYDYKLVLDKDGSGSGLKLSYGLTEVTIRDGKTLELTGTSADEDDNELTAALKGTGNLRITEGEVTLVDKDSDYTGSTSVAAGAALVAGSAGHTLGQTSELRLEGATGVVSGASATILGEETVYGLNVQLGATLNLVAGSGEGAGAVLTVAGGEDDNVIAGNDALGQGGGKLAVSGDGTKLTVEGANSRFTGITSVESGAVLSAGNTASLGTGNTEIAAGGTLEVVAAVDATSGASRVVSQITNSVTGAGDVVINLSGTAQANQKMFRFADDQTSGFSGNIVLENGGYSLAYANDGDAETDYTANQLAAMNSRISVEENGHLYVSTVDHQINRYIDKHVRALTLNGGNIYFGGLRYDMTSMDESLGGQLQLAGDTDKSATLEIQPESLVNLDAGATNTLTDGSELLIADEGAKIDLIQNAADVVLGSDADTIWASSSDEADFTDLLNDYLKLNTVNSDAEQTLTQDGRDVAIVTRGFGSSGHNEVFGVEQNDSSTWDLYLNYHVSKIELIDSENAQGLLITNDEAGSDSDLTALVTGSGNLTLSGVSGTTIALGDGSDATQNDYTGRTTVTGSVTVKAAEDNAFGNTYRLNVESGAKVDFGEFDQTLGILEARGDDALAGTADSVVTITDDMIVTGKNDGFQSQLRLEFSGTGTVTDVGGLGTGDISIGEDYTLVIADENASDGNRVGNNITGSGTVVIGRDDATGTIELGGSNAGFTGNVRVESDWALEASMDKGETAADRIGSGNLVLSSGATGSFTQTEGSLDWTSAVIGEGDLVLSAGKDSDVTISGGLDYFNGDITIGGGRFELASGNGNVENVDGSNLHATGEDTTVVVADQGTVILGDDLSVESGASIVFEGDVTPGTIGDAQLVVAGDLTITESNVTINVGGELDPGDPDTASLNVQDVTSADRSDELALVIAEADNIVLSGNDLVVLGPDGNPINNPEDRLGVSIVDGDEEIATGFYDFGLTSSESGGRDILGVGYQLMEVNVKDGKTLVLNGAHAADVDYENASSFDADITGNGNFALANGELTLTGKNTYTGSTLVGDGTSETTLTVDRGSSLGDTSAVNVSDNATLVNRSDLTAAGSIQVASGGTVTLEDGSVFKVTDAANESNIAGTLTGSGALHLNDNVDIDVAADKAQNFTGIVSVGSGAVYNLLSTVTDTVTVASRFESDAGDDAVVGMTGDFSLEAENTAYHGAFVLSDGTVIRTDSIASLGAADATITTAGDYAEAGGTASQADDNATVILDYADRETVGDVTQTMTSGITFVKTGDGVVELSAESLGAGAVKSSEGGIIFGAAGDSTVFGTALTVEGGAWAAGFGGVGSLSVASDGAFYLGGVDGYNSIVSSGWTSSEGSSTVQFTVSGNVTNNGTIYVGNKNSPGDTPADSNYIGNELVIEGDYITDGGTLDLNAIIAGKDNSKSDHVTIKGEIDGTGFIDVNYDSSVSTGGELEYLGLVSVAEGESGDSLKLKDSIKIGDLYYRLMWSSEQNEYYLQSSVTDPGDDPWNTEDVENIHAGTRSALAFMQAQAFDLSLRGHLGETLYVDPVTGEQRKSSFWMVQRGDWTKFSNASGQMDADGNLYTTHLGTDLFKRETDGATFRWGVLAGFADGDFDVSSNVDGKSSKGSFRGYSAGLYMTAESKAESGPFLGLQLRWNRFDNEVGPDDYDVNGLSLTAEASWDQLLSKGLTDGGRHYEWRLEPHVRAYWTNFSDPGNWTSRLGETYSSDFDNGLLVRVGARTKIQTTLGTGPAWQAYAEANWVYNNGDYSTTMSTQYGDVTSTQNGAEFAEFRLGLEAQFTTNVNVWLEGHHQTGSDDYESTGAMFGFKYMW